MGEISKLSSNISKDVMLEKLSFFSIISEGTVVTNGDRFELKAVLETGMLVILSKSSRGAERRSNYRHLKIILFNVFNPEIESFHAYINFPQYFEPTILKIVIFTRN